MEFDALDAGVAPGGLRSRREIRLLVCYLLANVERRVKRRHIVDALLEGDIANYFEINSAIEDLVEDRNVREDADGFLCLKLESRDAIDTLETELPYTIRVKATALCAKMAAREIYREENRAEIEPCGSGYYVNCALLAENEDDMLRFRLYVGSISQAEIVRDRFLDDPVSVYETVIDALFPPGKPDA